MPNPTSGWSRFLARCFSTVASSTKSWTPNFVATHVPVMDLSSVWRYRDYAIRAERGEVRADGLVKVKLRHPMNRTIYLREIGSDQYTFREVIIERVYQVVLDNVPACTTMIDLGANIGLASIFLSAHYKCQVFAVEPNPVTHNVLSRNLSNPARERTICAGVWSKPAALSAAPDAGDTHYSMFSTVESPGGGITGLPMSELLARSGFKTVDLLKVDIEGAERHLFTGNLDWLSSVRAIAIEFHDNSREEVKFDEIMGRYGFRIVCGDGHTVLAVAGRN